MTSTTEILNDTTSVQSRIDTVLSAEGNQLDWSNDTGWQPGDPIYQHPYVRAWRTEELSVVPREMVQVIDEPERDMRCTDCAVSWSGPEPCWSCGTDCPPRRRSSWLHSPMPDIGPALASVEAMVRASARRSVAVARAREDALGAVPVRVVMGFDGSRDDDVAVFVAAPDRMWVLPSVSDVHAPTVAELSSAAGFVLEPFQHALVNAWFGSIERLGVELSRDRSCPLPLPIDGHAYRRRRRSRRSR